ECIVVFVRDPEKDHKNEEAEKLLEGFPALPSLFFRDLAALDLLDRVVPFSRREGNQGDKHQPSRELEGDGVAEPVADFGQAKGGNCGSDIDGKIKPLERSATESALPGPLLIISHPHESGNVRLDDPAAPGQKRQGDQ